ncbi:MAG: thiamine pyrophosphate-binding protein [Candidatus Limnocylindria bacterium]
MLAFTSVGPGATNTVVGMATAYVDSTDVALFTGSPHTYLRGHGLLQELQRRHIESPMGRQMSTRRWSTRWHRAGRR